MLKLQKMTLNEYEIFRANCISLYIKEKIRANGFTEEEATKIANDDFNRILPDGFNSKNNFLLALVFDNSCVGHLWYCIRGIEKIKRAFICDIFINENSRGKGLGRKAMTLLESEVKSQNISKIELHAFGHNEIAINLYKSLGYIITDVNMEKKIVK